VPKMSEIVEQKMERAKFSVPNLTFGPPAVAAIFSGGMSHDAGCRPIAAILKCLAVMQQYIEAFARLPAAADIFLRIRGGTHTTAPMQAIRAHGQAGVGAEPHPCGKPFEYLLDNGGYGLRDER